MTTWATQNKSASPTWATISANVASWVAQAKTLSGLSYLLLENGSYLLQENGDKIILDQSSSTSTSWDNLAKS